MSTKKKEKESSGKESSKKTDEKAKSTDKDTDKTSSGGKVSKTKSKAEIPPTDEMSKLKVSKQQTGGVATSSTTVTSATAPASSAAKETAKKATVVAQEESPPGTPPEIAVQTGDDKKGGIDKDIMISAHGQVYKTLQVVGTGSFGVVIQAQIVETGELVAIKKVLQDKRFKNRELQIMRLLTHPNIVALKNSFFTTGSKPADDVYLNLVLEYVPETVYRVARQYTKQKQHMPMLYIKCYIYQLLKALEYIHALGICHRDIKPQNLLLDTENSILKLCDFGSAKILVKGEPNVAYICSRYYRAPELIFGATAYTTAIDVWSTGCVLAELMLGAPMFPGASGMDQLVEIIKVLGTPTREQIKLMNPKYTEFRFPQIKAHPWNRVFRARTEQAALDLVDVLLVYDPFTRVAAVDATKHSFFDELRDASCVLPNGKQLPRLIDIAHTQKD